MNNATEQQLLQFRQQLTLRRYSKNTLTLYIQNIRSLASHFDRPLEQLTSDDIRRYLLHLVDVNHLSGSTQHAALSAFKFFYKHILRRPIDISNIPRPGAPKRLPAVLNRDEIRRLLDAVANPKHRMVFYIIYACGLRISEAVKLRIPNIDGLAGQIAIRGAKGNKDRFVPISRGVLEELRKYWRTTKPKDWLFPSNIRNWHVSVRTIQQVYSQACRRARIVKNVTVHSLRHSYATHLLEQGVDIRYIQEILGHKSIKTTQIYTHVSNTSIKQIRSPAEFLAKDPDPGPFPSDRMRILIPTTPNSTYTPFYI